jgi:Bacterial membrane protein YfhO
MNRRGVLAGTAVASAAIALSACFWWPLFHGAALVGGDVYSYYIPQKVVYAEDLHRLTLPLWNDRAGHGYPILGESQTGVFYPTNLLLYAFLPVNAAYNVNHLLHYLLAFVFAWLYARSINLSGWGSGLAALVYTYGWFPPRSCWEWAIIGGAWMPAAFWCLERFFATRRWRFAFGLSGALALQLLDGHFNLAFFTVLTLFPYAGLRLFLANRGLPDATRSRKGRCLAISLACVACGFALAAVQLAPVWELKTLSQRATPGAEHRLAQGSIPLAYWSEMVCPWRWYALDVNRDEFLANFESVLGAPTNQVEAQLYFGLIPLALAIAAIILAIPTGDRLSLIWAVFGVFALLYTPGWFLGATGRIPGFNFFQDPGRYGVITTFAVGILAGRGLDRLRETGSLWISVAVLVGFAGAMWTALELTAQGQTLVTETALPSPFTLGPFTLTDGAVTSLILLGLVAIVVSTLALQLRPASESTLSTPLARATLTGCVLLVTALDLWIVSRVFLFSGYTQMVDDPPINHLDQSPIQQILGRDGGVDRVYEPQGLGNLLTVFDTAKTPVYLTFGPEAYVNPQLVMPASPLSKKIDWLRRAGVTHVLSSGPLDGTQWPVRPVWAGRDPVLSPAAVRREPLYLYELEGSRGRVAWQKPGPDHMARVVAYRSDRIDVDARSPDGGRLILTDLMYPGWTVTVDGKPAEPIVFEGMFRSVDVPAGEHKVVWCYRPRSVYWGMAVSVLTLLFLAAVAHVRYWYPQRLRFLDETQKTPLAG